MVGQLISTKLNYYEYMLVILIYFHSEFFRLFFKKFGLNPGGTPRNLSDRNFEEPSKPFVDDCLKLKKENPGWSDSEVFDTAASNYRPAFSRDSRAHTYEADVEEALAMASKRHGRKTPTVSAQSLLSLFKEAQEQQQKKTDSVSTKNINDTDTGTKDPK